MTRETLEVYFPYHVKQDLGIFYKKKYSTNNSFKRESHIHEKYKLTSRTYTFETHKRTVHFDKDTAAAGGRATRVHGHLTCTQN